MLATFTVTNLLNAGEGSLRWAIHQANANAGADDVAFAVPNARNGLRITNSDNTTVQANFPGVGADNATVVANGQSGILIKGRAHGNALGSVNIASATGITYVP